MKKHLWILALLIVGLSVWHLQAPVEFDDNGNPLRTAIDDPNALQRGRQTVPVGDRVLPSEYHPDQGTVQPRSTNQQPRNTATTITAPVTVKPTGEFPGVDPTGAQQTDVTDDLGGASQGGNSSESFEVKKHVEDLTLSLNALSTRVSEIETQLTAADPKVVTAGKNSAKRLQGEFARIQKQIDGFLSADVTEKTDLQTTLTTLRTQLTGLLAPKGKSGQVAEQPSLTQRLQELVGKFESIQEAITKDPTSFEKKQRELASLERELTKFKKEAKGLKDDALTNVIKQCDDLIVAINKKKPQSVVVVEIPGLSQQVLASKYPAQIEPPHNGQQLKKLLCGLFDAFPKEVNPLRGTVMVDNGELTQLYNEAKAREEAEKQQKLAAGDATPIKRNFITELFAINPEAERSFEADRLISTQLPVNVARGLTAKTIAQLIRFIQQDPATLNTLINAKGKVDLIEQWYADYFDSFGQNDVKPLEVVINKKTGKEDNSLFYQNVRAFLRLLQEHATADRQQSTDFLLSFLELQMRRKESIRAASIQDYAQALGVDYTLKYYTEDDYIALRDFFSNQTLTQETVGAHLDELLFYVERARGKDVVTERLYFNNLAHMTYDGNGFTGCKENLSRTLFSMVFYNPETGRLDINMVPETVRSLLPQATQDFITQYGDLDVHDPASEAAWLQLVENKEGIRYKNKKNGVSFEITGGIDNGVSVFKMLFGISDEALDAVLQKDHKDLDVTTVSSTEKFVTLLKMLSYPGVHELQIDNVNGTGDDGAFDFSVYDPKTQFTVKAGISWDKGHGQSIFLSPEGVLNDAVIKNLYLGGKSLGQFLLGAYRVPCSFMLTSLIRTGVLKTEYDFLQFFRSYSSAFDKALPDALYEGSWYNFAENCSNELLKEVVQAAQKVGFSMSRPLVQNAFLSDFIKNACVKGDASTAVETVVSLGLKQSLAIVKIVLNESGGTPADKTKILKFLLQKGLSMDDIFDLWVAKGIPSNRLQMLVGAGLDLNEPLTNGLTPLESVLTAFNNKLLLSNLEKCGASPSARTYTYVTGLVGRGVKGLFEMDKSTKLYLDQAQSLQSQIEKWIDSKEEQVPGREPEEGDVTMTDDELKQLKLDAKTLAAAIKQADAVLDF